MLTRVQKEKILEELTDKLKRAALIVFVDPTGVGVNKLKELRRSFDNQASDFKMYKKTLLRLAFKEMGLPKEWLEQFKGSVALAVSYDAELNIAKPINDFIKSEKNLRIVGGIFDGKYLEGKEVIAIAKLPPREVILGALAGAIAGPLRSLLYVLNGNLRNLAVVLSQIKK